MRVADLLVSLKEERAALLLKTAPLRDAREKLRAKLQPLEDQMRAMNIQIREMEGSKLFELDNEIGALTRSLKTTKQLSAESANVSS